MPVGSFNQRHVGPVSDLTPPRSKSVTVRAGNSSTLEVPVRRNKCLTPVSPDVLDDAARSLIQMLVDLTQSVFSSLYCDLNLTIKNCKIILIVRI